ncbi:UNVERIFIED_CONTAM: uncharacterized protein YqhQ [Acetivibrio alkalicellulosi]
MKYKEFGSPKHKTNIGGQALIEGLMMIGPEQAAIAIRKPDGEILIEKRPTPKKSKVSKLPILRGAVGLFKQLVLGFKALMFSAEFVDIEADSEEEEKPSKFEKFLTRVFGDKLQEVIIYFSVILSLMFSVGLFMLLPNFVSGITLSRLFNLEKETSNVLIFNFFEGFLRIGLFFTYLLLVSKMKDIMRIWQYHGAEHKTIHCYEHGEELTVENIKKYTTKHPRCGTSFFFTVMVVSILVFSMTGWHHPLINIVIRLALLPVVAGISYEITRFAGRSESTFVRIISAPGLFFQNFTTKEPDESQIEVAIEAMKNVMVEDKEKDKW